ncbi:uncharacterized protein N7515_009084 [Penicillium bovifimosum]|uniref:Uncharacterized protein n=1 Tax=Penicillium bovifimosum TaxID=126998 RepID=A0A9W9GIM1_9EURO|nr:uncharacterized protein N7515_009084 [Penicillium bovifimosum]KAJ5121123.1 hypothetical protein N7515_009084 [Penicillium bovifimosum]
MCNGPAPNAKRKKEYNEAMNEDPEWKAFVAKKREEEKPSKSQANTVLQSGELGFLSMSTTNRQQVESTSRIDC